MAYHAASHMAAKRAAQRDLKISPILDVKRRRRCMRDTFRFLQVYFGGIFSQPFTSTRKQMIEAIEHAARYGGDQAIAGPRGDGKTRSALFVALKLLLQGALRFPVIISKSGPRAHRELRNLKDAITNSPLLAADFPEVIEPILALGGWGSRARQQTAYGVYTQLEWAEECVILPTISTKVLREHGWTKRIESAATGQVLASLGVEGPIRGYSVRNERPDLVILDDIDDRESARSELQTENREAIIEQDVGGLAGPDKTVARVMLCTLINTRCVAATYTDRSRKPSWRPQRHKLLDVLPDRMDLWEDYIALRQGRDETDPDARRAHRFYLDNRHVMDAGAAVTNPYRFDNRPLANGEPGQVSALQFCFDLIADRGWEHFNTEFQNDPPEEQSVIESGISAERIQRRLSGYERGIVPPDCNAVTAGIDLQKAGAHWVVKAWRSDGTNYVIDYGFTESHGVAAGSDVGVELSVRNTVIACVERWREQPYSKPDGECVDVAPILVDSGWQSAAVYQACVRLGKPVFPAKGHGKSHGCATPSFSETSQVTRDRKPGDGWFLTKGWLDVARRRSEFWLVHADADRWKSFEHARWLTTEGKPGAAYVYGVATADEQRWSNARLPVASKQHFAFTKHLTAEIEAEDVVRGKLATRWMLKAGRVQNHYLDASYMANVAASMMGVRILGNVPPKAARLRPRISAAVEEIGAR